MNWKNWYRFLCDVRNVLNRWIAHARARAYPRLAKHVADTENQPRLP